MLTAINLLAAPDGDASDSPRLEVTIHERSGIVGRGLADDARVLVVGSGPWTKNDP